jgi:hypothetical protein
VEGLGEVLSNLGPLGGVGAGTILFMLMILVFMGKIPTPATVRQLEARIADRDAEIARERIETAHWREAWTNVNAAHLENSKQLEKLVEKTDARTAHDELVVSILQSLRNQAGLTT